MNENTDKNVLEDCEIAVNTLITTLESLKEERLSSEIVNALDGLNTARYWLQERHVRVKNSGREMMNA